MSVYLTDYDKDILKSSKIKEEQKILVDISQNLDAQIQEEKKNIHKKFELD